MQKIGVRNGRVLSRLGGASKPIAGDYPQAKTNQRKQPLLLEGAPPGGSLTVELTSGPNKPEATAARAELEIKPEKPDLYALAAGVSRSSQSS